MHLLLNQNSDQVVRTQLQSLGRLLPVFQLCGYTGFVLGFAQSMILVKHLRLSPLTFLGITGVVILTFCTLMMVTKILAGEEIIIYYHHEIAVVVVTAVFLRLTRQSVLPYLDITVLGIGLFLSCGRLGCLMVGCCHGRPCRWGIAYRDEHAHAGFPAYLVGVKLFPIQAVESVFAACIVVSGTVLLLKRCPPGTALAFYIVSYGMARFCFEFARGDTARPYLGGFSEAQWTSLLLALALAGGEQAKIVPASRWHWAVAIAMGAAMVLISVWRRFDSSRRFELLHPRHVREIIGALDYLERPWQPAQSTSEFSRHAAGIHIAHTSLGYRISSGQSVIGPRHLKHYSVSKGGGSLSLRAAQVLARLLARFEQSPSSFNVIQTSTGVFHILFDSCSATEYQEKSSATPAASHEVLSRY